MFITVKQLIPASNILLQKSFKLVLLFLTNVLSKKTSFHWCCKPDVSLVQILI